MKKKWLALMIGIGVVAAFINPVLVMALSSLVQLVHVVSA